MPEQLVTLIKEPLFAVAFTLVLYVGSRRLYQRRHILIFNPLILAPAIIIGLKIKICRL